MTSQSSRSESEFSVIKRRFQIGLVYFKPTVGFILHWNCRPEWPRTDILQTLALIQFPPSFCKKCSLWLTECMRKGKSKCNGTVPDNPLLLTPRSSLRYTLLVITLHSLALLTLLSITSTPLLTTLCCLHSHARISTLLGTTLLVCCLHSHPPTRRTQHLRRL